MHKVTNVYLVYIFSLSRAVRNPNWAGKAASMMVLFLVLGIFCGIQFSLAFPAMSELGAGGAVSEMIPTTNSSLISYY